KLSVTDNPDVQNVTTAKRGFSVSLASSAVVPPRETATMQVAAINVKDARDKILAAASTGGSGARVLQSQLNENDQQNVNATIELDVKRGEPLTAVEKAVADAGQTI